MLKCILPKPHSPQERPESPRPRPGRAPSQTHNTMGPARVDCPALREAFLVDPNRKSTTAGRRAHNLISLSWLTLCGSMTTDQRACPPSAPLETLQVLCRRTERQLVLSLQLCRSVLCAFPIDLGAFHFLPVFRDLLVTSSFVCGLLASYSLFESGSQLVWTHPLGSRPQRFSNPQKAASA